MSVMSGGFVLILVVYVLLIAVIGAVIYLIIRFAVRDGLRGHQLWLERTHRVATGAGPETTE